jgi:hypothetical protein
MGPLIVATASAAIAAIAASAIAGASVPPDRGGDPGTPSAMQVERRLAGLEVPFETNAGRFDPQVAFSARTFAGTLFVTRDGALVHSLAGRTTEPDEAATGKPRRGLSPSRGAGWTLTETLVGAKVRPTGAMPSVTKVSHFVGSDPSKWVSDVATWQRVSLGAAWPGITVELAARGSNVEKLFTVAPGADARRIGMRLRGAKWLELAADGSLVAHTGNGPITFTAPVAWQEIATERRPVEVAYALKGNRYGFRLGAHDPAHAVVIDPLLQSTYLGGTGNDDIRAVAVGGTGDVYVAGRTDSTTFPGTIGGSQPPLRGGTDAFIARFDSSLRTLKQATYLGGSGVDDAVALQIDPSGAIVVAGSTGSPDFPGTAGAAQAAFSGNGDGFVARLDAGLTALTRATYVGGTAQDDLSALAIDAAGNVFVAGSTYSDDFPATAGAVQASRKGPVDGFVTRLDGSLTAFLRSTYLGGSAHDGAYGVAVNRSGDVFVAGVTDSKDFPGTAGGAQPSNGNATFPTSDAFIARLSGDLTVSRQATYLGGVSSDWAVAIALDARGDVFTAGKWDSFTTLGNRVYGDPFVAKHNGALTQRLGMRTLAGNGGARLVSDTMGGLAIDAAGNVFVAGSTPDVGSPFPGNYFPGTKGGAQEIFGGVRDAFVARFDNALAALVQSTYVGGADSDSAAALTFDPAGNVVVVGTTSSVDLPARLQGYQPALNGPSDSFVTRLTATLRGDDGPQAATPIDVPLLPAWLLATLAVVIAGLGGLSLSARGR